MIRLPPFVFLNGPSGSGKSTIAKELATHDPNLSICSFAEPIRMALLSTFHPEQMTEGLDLRDGAVKASLIPGTGVTYRQWMVAFSETFMKPLFGKQIFGDLAKRQTETLSRYYDRFVFDDSRFESEIRPFALAFGGQNILIVRVERTGASWSNEPSGSDLTTMIGVHHAAVINNGTPQQAVEMLAAALGQTWKPKTEGGIYQPEEGDEEPSADIIHPSVASIEPTEDEL